MPALRSKVFGDSRETISGPVDAVFSSADNDQREADDSKFGRMAPFGKSALADAIHGDGGDHHGEGEK